jgi:hypothetical protein
MCLRTSEHGDDWCCCASWPYQLGGRRDVGDGELHQIARTIIKDNRLFDPPDLGCNMPRVSKWER